MTPSFLPLKLVQNPIVVNIDAADPLGIVKRSGLRYFLELMVPDFYGANTYSKLVEFEGSERPPETVAGGVIFRGAFFELQDQLDSLLHRTAPTFGQTGISICDGLITPYYVKARTTNNDALVSQVAFPVQYAMKAGVSGYDFQVYKNVFFTDFIGKAGRFLTWAHDCRTVQAGQPEFLYWLCNCSPLPAGLKLKVEVIPTTPSETRDVFTAATMASATPMTVYCLAVGPDALGITTRPGMATAYKVWLEDSAGTILTEVRTYKLEQEIRRNVRHIVFANSLGGFDTIRLIGKGEETVSYGRDISDRYPDYAFNPSYSEKVINSVTGERQLIVSTGWIPVQRRDYLQELALTKEAYIVTDRAFIPLIPAVGSLKQVVDDEGLIGRTLAFDYANPERNFSKLPALAAAALRPTAWRPKAVACLLDNNGRRTGKKGVMMLEKYYLDDGSRVVEAPFKANTQGTEGYIPPEPSADCKDTPFLSAAINRSITFVRATCTGGDVGGPAPIVIPAGTYGSEVSQADADAKAEADYSRNNSQEYANTYGSCNPSPELYDVVVPPGCWHYRTGRPTQTTVVFSNLEGYPIWGNSQVLAGSGGANTYPYGTNDINFPANNDGSWGVRVYGAVGSRKRVRTYVNGALLVTNDITMNIDGYEQFLWIPLGYLLTAGMKIYIRIDDL